VNFSVGEIQNERSTFILEINPHSIMKKLQGTILAAALLASSALYAQVNTTSVLYSEQGSLTFVDYNHDQHKINATMGSVNLDGFKYVPNSFFNDEANNRVLFMTSSAVINGSQRLIIANPEHGSVVQRVQFNQSMLPVHIAKGNKIGMISTQRTFSGYNNNDDDNSFAIFNLVTGKLLGKVKLNSVSFSAVQAPFFGEIASTTNFNETVKVGIGSPEYIPELNEVAFCALDVTGTYRLFRIDVEGIRLKSSVALPHFVLDVKYDRENKNFIGLYVDESNSTRTIKVGKFSASGDLMESSEALRTLASTETEINNGTLRFDAENNQIIAYYDLVTTSTQYPYPVTRTQMRYLLDNEGLTQIADPTSFSSKEQKIDFNYPVDEVLTDVPTLNTSVQLFPNPALNTVNVETTENSRVLSIKIYSMDYKLVKDIMVEGGALNHALDISELAPGVYSVDIETAGANVSRKLIVQ